jgi:hypothetical protein
MAKKKQSKQHSLTPEEEAHADLAIRTIVRAAAEHAAVARMKAGMAPSSATTPEAIVIESIRHGKAPSSYKSPPALEDPCTPPQAKKNPPAVAKTAHFTDEFKQTTLTQLCPPQEVNEKERDTVSMMNELLQDEQDDQTGDEHTQVLPVQEDEVLCTGVKPAPPKGPFINRSINYSKTLDFSESKVSESPRNQIDFSVCKFCESSMCHDKLYKKYFQLSLENLAIHNKKKSLRHMEIYKHYLHSYNTLIQKQTLDAAGCVSEGVLTLPACIYAGSFTKLVTEWDEDEDQEREEVRNYIAWKKREKKRRKKSHSAVFTQFEWDRSGYEEGRRRKEE